MTTSLRFALPFAAAATLAGPDLLAQTPKDDAVLLAEALNRFAANAHARLSQSGPAICSPASIGIALLMVLPGAAGETAAELESVLQLPEGLAGDRLNKAAAKLLASLRSTGTKEETIELRLVDELWAQTDFELVPGFVRTLRDHFASEVHPVDFVADPDGARQKINAAIAATTNQRIPRLIPKGLIDTDTRLVLTNALWLRGAWLHAFREKGTKPAPFILAGGTQVEVPTMHVVEEFGYVADERYQLVRMPFVDPTYVCDVLLPAKGVALDDVQQQVVLGQYQAKLGETRVHIALPRFKVAAAHRLREALEALGLHRAFDGARADFSGIRKERDLCIDEVVHQTWIAVDEKGAEAAAATAVILKRWGAPAGDPVQFTADRPFAFVIRHAPTGLILFTGRVDDPSVAPQ